jgi:hypothetical protein
LPAVPATLTTTSTGQRQPPPFDAPLLPRLQPCRPG